jgi:hypothetical protein
MWEFLQQIFFSWVRNHTNNEVEDIPTLNKKLTEGESCLEATTRDLAILRYV